MLSGRVKMKAYNRYLSAIGYVTSVAVVGLFVANQV